MTDLRIRELAVLAPVVAVGLVGTSFALSDRGADTQFLRDQQHTPALRAQEVERVVRTAPDPATGTGSGVAAECRAGSPRSLRNPWRCVVRYAGGRRVTITVRVNPDGSYLGRYAGGGAARGCCVEIPGVG
jgi:hypothetical protein